MSNCTKKKRIGHGSISKKKQAAAYILTINNISGLIVLSNLINGKMRGLPLPLPLPLPPKYSQFTLLIEYLNNKCPNLNMKPLGFNQSPLESDSWLSGFIEADGSFQVRTSLSSKYPRVSLSF